MLQAQTGTVPGCSIMLLRDLFIHDVVVVLVIREDDQEEGRGGLT